MRRIITVEQRDTTLCVTAVFQPSWQYELSLNTPMAGAIVTTETSYTLIAQQSCDQVCIDFQWLL